jgi:protocatechuate 3,4-dioxygenase beta subunit
VRRWCVVVPAFFSGLLLFESTPLLAGVIRGRLLLGGKPAAGVTVSAIPYEAPLDTARREAKGGEEPKAIATATSGLGGDFALTVAVDPPRSFVVRAFGGGIRPVEFDAVYESAETEDLGEHVLAAGAVLTGKIVDGRGEPVGGAAVTLIASTPGDAELLPAPAQAVTAADGSFHLDGAAGSQGTNRLRIEKPGYAPVSETIPRAGALAKPVVLPAGIALAGHVRPLPGRSAGGTLVRFEARAVTRWVEAAADGSFTIPDAPAGVGTLVADAGDSGFGETTGLLLPLPEGKSAVVALSPAASLGGRVVDAKTLRGVARAKVEVRQGAVTRSGRSGPDGSYRIAPVAPRAVRVTVNEPRYVPFRKGLEIAPGQATKLDITLTPGASIAGRVTDENGQPVAGARGVLERSGPTGLRAVLRRLREEGGAPLFRTAADGTYHVSRLAPGANQSLLVAHPDFTTATVGGLNLMAGRAGPTVTVVLRRGAVLSGLVHDADGHPIEGAEAEAQQGFGLRGGRRGGAILNLLGGRGGSLEHPAVRTGADGRFEIRGLAPGDYTLWVRKSAMATERIDPVKVPETGSPEAVSVTLGPGATISGTVLLRSGAPAEGWSVVASEPGTSPLGPRARGALTPTGSDGLFVLDGLKPGRPYDLRFFGGSGVGPSRTGIVPPAAGLEIVVAGAGRITGRVVDARTSRPITAYTVAYVPERGGGGLFRIVDRVAGRQVTGIGEKHEVSSDDGSFVLEDVPPGTWSVVVEAKGYQPARAGNVVVEEGGTAKDVEVRASLGGHLSGRVVDALTGQPVPGANVTSGSAGPAGAAAAAVAGDSGEEQTTDADGTFVLDGIAPGKVLITVTHPDYSDAHQTVDVTEGAPAAEIRMSAGGAIGGVVLSDAGQPLSGADVVLQAAGDTGFGRLMAAEGSSAVTDATGHFRFDHLPAGRYTLEASLRSQKSPPLAVVLADGQVRDDALLQIAAGATLQGVVSGIPDSWKNGMTVAASGANSWSGSTRTGADGRFQFTGVPTGTVTLRGTAGDFAGSSRSVMKQVEMPEGQEVVETELAFDPGYVLSGRVSRAGQPLPNVTVVANLIGGGGRQASSRTDDSGSYRLEGLVEGTYNVLAMTEVLGGSTQSREVTLNGDETLDITIPSARLGGTVVDAQGNAPLPDAVVQVVPSDPNASSSGVRSTRSATTDSSGSFLMTDLDPQGYAVSVRKPDYLFEKRDVTAAEEGTDALTFLLSRGEGIGVVGRDGVYGVPLHGLMVRVLDASGSSVFTGAISLDGSGNGEIPSLKPGVYALTAAASGYAVATIPGINVPCAPVTVALTPGGSVEIRSGPKTLAAGTARAQVLTAAGQPYPLSLFSPDGQVALSTSVRRIDNLAPGSYLLAVAGADRTGFSVQEGGLTVVELP